MPPALCKNYRPWLNRLALLLLAPLLGLGTGCYLLWLEYHSHYAARHIGAYLMQQNQQRAPRGALWQGILASRETRTALADSLSESDLITASQHAPIPVLSNRYHLQRHGPYAAFLSVVRRPAALKADNLPPEALRELALSLQIYRQGRTLISAASIPADLLHIHALISTQVALEDDSLFPTIHKRLLDLNAPEAWTFLRMEQGEMDFWRTQLVPLLNTSADSTYSEVSPQLRGVLQDIVESSQDSLRQHEIERLLKAWDNVNGFELRLTRSGDQFAAYALFPGEAPTAFSLSTQAVEKYLQLISPETDQ